MVPERYPGYDVLAKRDGLSWNDPTRRVVAERLAVKDEPVFFAHEEFLTLRALCDRILPQPVGRERLPLAAYVDRKLLAVGDAGTRYPPMPADGAAWKIALKALDAEARSAHDLPFHGLLPADADTLLARVQQGDAHDPEWGEVPPKLFFAKRILADIPAAYYAHPAAWSEIGFGGPASPRGYVRMQADRHDPWEAAEAKPGAADKAREKNRHVR
jgi:hypothetical protein